MSANGIGRGRGWLNKKINSANINTRPGGTPSPTLVQSSPSYENQTNNFKSSNLVSPAKEEKYQTIFNAINMLDVHDDGIKFNQKLKYISEILTTECKLFSEQLDCFDAIYSKSLRDSDFASKLVGLVSMRSSTTILFLGKLKAKPLFIGKIQEDFNNCKQLQIEDPIVFRNSVRMLGGFLHKFRSVEGKPLEFLYEPALQYLDMLLESAQPPDLQLFTSQLYINGGQLKAAFPEKISDILIQVRLLLFSKANLTTHCKVWLLLALDVANHRFGVLPADLQLIYQTHLGEKAMAEFQGSHSALCIKTSRSKALDSFQSPVSVLQMKIPPAELSSSENETTTTISSSKMSSTSQSIDYGTDTSLNIDTWEPPKEKTPRPILGAGARLRNNDKNTHVDEEDGFKSIPNQNNSYWRAKANENSTGWDSKQKDTHGSGWDGSYTNRNKGWEHDDRFENDYN